MKINRNGIYQAPALKVAVIELEQGIAASSATITTGNAPAGATITVTDIPDDDPTSTQQGDF